MVHVVFLPFVSDDIATSFYEHLDDHKAFSYRSQCNTSAIPGTFWIERVGNRGYNTLCNSTHSHHIALRYASKRLKLQGSENRWYGNGKRKIQQKHCLMLLLCLQVQDSDLSPNVGCLNQSKEVKVWQPSLHFCPNHVFPFPLWHISDNSIDHSILLDQ